MHCGAPAGGMNTASRAAAILAFNRGHTPLAINNGFAGLMSGNIRTISRMDVDSLVVEGGSAFGTNRVQPAEDLGLCAFQMQKHNIQALLVIGGFEGFTALLQLQEGRKTYPSFCIPMALIPATISNNVPGTELSLGADTALNVIIEACDRIRQSAFSSRKRVFVVEVQGGRCGFLATLAGLQCGATCAYVPELGIDLQMISDDCKHLIRQFKTGENQGRVILRNENASETYTTEVISSIFRAEGQGIFDSRSSILGHIQQGGMPSPMDRVRATRLAVDAVSWMEKVAFPTSNTLSNSDINVSLLQQHNEPPSVIVSPRDGSGKSTREEAIDVRLFEQSRLECVDAGAYTADPCSVAVVGVWGVTTSITPVKDLVKDADFKNRSSKRTWWKHLNGLIRVLAKYGVGTNANK